MENIRVLMLEDSPADAELNEIELEKGGISHNARRVDTREDFIRELEEFFPHIILSDHSVPRFGGLAALQFMREKGPDIPFIFVTGTIGEDTAIDTLKLGATDYVLKGRLSRLAPAVKRALREAEEKKIRRWSEEALQVTHRFLSVVNRHNQMNPLLRESVNEIMSFMGCSSAGIRVIDEKGCVTHRSYRGFPVDFCLGQDLSQEDCAYNGCGAVINQETDSLLPFFTSGGSFHTGRLTGYFASLPDGAREKICRRCSEAGYESEAVVPIRAGGRVTGLIQVAETYVNAFSPGKVQILEKIALELGTAVERVKAETREMESEARYRKLIENMRDMLFTIDLKGNITFVNPAAEAITGYSNEKLLSMNAFDLLPAEYDKEIQKNERGELTPGGAGNAMTEARTHEVEMLHSSGKRLWMQVSSFFINDSLGNPLGLQGIVRDITAQRNLEKQLGQAQKMEAIGNLSEGIAHDFNNLLMAILGNLQIAKIEVKNNATLTETLSIVEEVTGRAAELVRQLLNFGRPQKTEEQVLSLSRVLKDTLGFLRSVIPTTISFARNISKDPCTIKADPSLLTQIITNLCVNARDSMPRGGTLSCFTGPVKLDENYCQGQIGARAGDYILLTIADTGTGIPPEIRDRIFEPFFTTKDKDRGTGLGLSMVYSAVRQMDGWINVYSEPGKGTEFKIYFPHAPGDAKVIKKAEAELRGGKETILFADDEDTVRTLGIKILEKYGYTVIGARDAEEAISLFRDNQKDISLAIIDQTMPRGGGARALDEIRKLSPGFPVIIASGYSSDIIQKDVREHASTFIPKPFSAQRLLRTVRGILDGGETDGGNGEK